MKGSITLNTLWRLLFGALLVVVGVFMLSAPASFAATVSHTGGGPVATSPVPGSARIARGQVAPPPVRAITSVPTATPTAAARLVHASSGGTTTTTTPGTETFSGTRSNPTPYVPSTQPIYVPVPATTLPPSSSPSNGLPRYEAASSASSLAYTGSDIGPLAAVGGGAVLSGLGLVALSRRRPKLS
jgi:hypothetical protein